MQSLGLIETKGLIAAIEGADAMLKAANVKLVEKTYVGSGLVTVTITGDVGAVKAAVDAGCAAIINIDKDMLISKHVIARPHDEINEILFNKEIIVETRLKTIEQEEQEVQEIQEIQEIQEEQEVKQEATVSIGTLNRKNIEKALIQNGLESVIEALDKFKVVKLRQLAREYSDFAILGREISRADKKNLIEAFRTYYSSLRGE